jgi:hypothetical protein
MLAVGNQACIVGTAHTEYSRDSGSSDPALACQALGAAIADAAGRRMTSTASPNTRWTKATYRRCAQQPKENRRHLRER